MLRPYECISLFYFFIIIFNSPSNCNSFGSISHRAFKTRFPPAFHAVIGLFVLLDNVDSAFLLYGPENSALLNAMIKGQYTYFLMDSFSVP